MAYKQIRRRMKQELGQNEGATPQVSDTSEVSQIQTDRELMTADDAMALQDLMGNRATGQLMGVATPPTPPRMGYVQPKPTPSQSLRRVSSNEPAYARVMRRLTDSQAGEKVQPKANQLQRWFGKKKMAEAMPEVAALGPHFTPNAIGQREDEPPDRYVFTVAVAQENADLIPFAKKRMQSTLRNKARKQLRKVPLLKHGVNKPKTNAQIKEQTARKVITQKKGSLPRPEEVQELINSSSAVGHTWVKLSTYSQGTLQKTYSFGFWPDGGFQHPNKAVPGRVRNPDEVHEGDSSKRFMDTEITANKYQETLNKIGQRKASPPQYLLIDYNCTKFAKEMAQVAGANFPSGAGMIIPVSSKGLFHAALNPNLLYEQMGKKEGVYEQSPEGAAEESVDNVAEQGYTRYHGHWQDDAAAGGEEQAAANLANVRLTLFDPDDVNTVLKTLTAEGITLSTLEAHISEGDSQGNYKEIYYLGDGKPYLVAKSQYAEFLQGLPN